MTNNLQYVVILSFSINPFLKKLAMEKINFSTGYILTQICNIIIISMYSIGNINTGDINMITKRNLFYSVLSSITTICGSISLSKLLKTNTKISDKMANIHFLNIIMSLLIEKIIKRQLLSSNEIKGLILICLGLRLLSN